MDLKTKLTQLHDFVDAEHQAGLSRIYEVWEKALADKINNGETQQITRLELKSDGELWADLGRNDSRYREGDMVCLHYGDAKEDHFIRGVSIDHEHDGQWLLTGNNTAKGMEQYNGGICYAEIDTFDLKPFYTKALDEIARDKIGREVIMPLLAGALDESAIYQGDFDKAAEAFADELNDDQQDAVGLGVGAKYLACIQGPPGTGKTKVISCICKLLVEQGRTVFLTSHTHMAINNALNKIVEQGVPTCKVGHPAANKSLVEDVVKVPMAEQWKARPEAGYVIGATPFATCSNRLEDYQFDTVIFDEASQITVPLALMAMRKAKRFVFVGDQKQLPPVVLSKSVLDKSATAIFGQLFDEQHDTSIMLSQTYRMSEELCQWPSKTFYQNRLKACGPNQYRQLTLNHQPQKFADVLCATQALTFIKSPGAVCRTVNEDEAQLVAQLVEQLLKCGLSPSEIGIVTPFRKHARKLKTTMARRGIRQGKVLTDTVERMQGQEREVVIISLCATDPVFLKNTAGFLFQPERLNVAVTRAQTKVILIGPVLADDFYVQSKEVGRWLDWYRDLQAVCATCDIASEVDDG